MLGSFRWKFLSFAQYIFIYHNVALILASSESTKDSLQHLPEILKLYESSSYDNSSDFYPKAKQANKSQFCRDLSKPIQCDFSAKFRTYDGTCNNLKNPHWGATLTKFRNIVRRFYDDDKSEPRGTRGGLPLPRKVSTTIHSDLIRSDRAVTHLLPTFGQFIVHDISLANLISGLDCCGIDAKNPNCMKLKIPADDGFYASKGITCISLPRARENCNKRRDGVREQINVLNSYIDMSLTYGNNYNRGRQLREGKGGRLLRNPDLKDFCPSIAYMNKTFGDAEWKDDFEYFATGDPRTNENPFLAAWHNLFFREHNRLAREIQTINSKLSDEAIFQTTRKIMGAILQKITYQDFLPIVIGQNLFNHYRLSITKTSTYSDLIPTNIIDAFTTAAMRFGHSLMSGTVLMKKKNGENSFFGLSDEMLSSRKVRISGGDGFNQIFKGMLLQNCQTMDRKMTAEMTQRLFKAAGKDFGGDLAARNIQRGRDLGVAPYAKFRKFCNLGRISSSWNDRPSEIVQEDWLKFKSVYKSPLDIDLFSGGLAERASSTGLVGPTFGCIIGLQFHDLKFGDRFFFTHTDQAGSMTTAQRKEIRQVTLGDIICRNTNLDSVNKDAFLTGNKASCNGREPFNVRAFL